MKWLPAILALLLLGGCASQQRTAEKGGGGGPSALGRYEAQFTPSDYDADSAGSHAAPTDSAGIPPPSDADTFAHASTELIPGFRVQLLATTSIDEVNVRKSQAEEAVPGEWFYIEFDPPTYKLRAGNFRTRFEADRFARMIAARGFADAWTVPGRVVKDPGPPPPPSHPTAPPDTTSVPH
ncbi:MAG TPA: SPOR domain-containing protein [Bacteroidota bacterium]